MTILNTILHPDVWLAIVGYFVMASTLMLLTNKIALYVEDIPADHWWYKAFSQWYVQHLWIPLTRALSLIVFIALAYPVIFGLQQAPSIITLLSTDHHFSTLVNVLFATAIILPLLPIIGNLHALILPLQSIAATSLIFSWLLPFFNATTISFWPDLKTILSLSIIALISHWAAAWISEQLGNTLDTWLNRKGYAILVYQLTLLLFQAPIILSYSLYLGQQL